MGSVFVASGYRVSETEQGVAMRIGALIFPTDLSIRVDRLARELEDRGFESLWVTEHTHIPTSRRTPWPGGRELPEEYKRTLDPYVALAAAGAVTKNLVLGTGVSLVAQHHATRLTRRSGGKHETGWVLIDAEGRSQSVDDAVAERVSRKAIELLPAAESGLMRGLTKRSDKSEDGEP